MKQRISTIARFFWPSSFVEFGMCLGKKSVSHQERLVFVGHIFVPEPRRGTLRVGQLQPIANDVDAQVSANRLCRILASGVDTAA